MTTTVNHDDALGADDAYTDQQGVFSEQKPRGRVPGETARTGGGTAKIFMIAFVTILVAAFGWFVWKLMNRGDTSEPMGESLPVAVASSVPMTGAPVEEPLRPVSLEEGPTASAATMPADPSLVAATSPALPPSSAASPPSMDPGVAPAALPHGASAPLESVAAPTARSQVAAPVTAETQVPVAANSAGDAAALRDSQLLKEALARIAVLERRVASLGPETPSKARSPEPSPKPRTVMPPRVTASPERKSDAAAKAAPTTGVTLKAVLEGRAWLQLGSGETVTAAPGDEVAGLGAVSSIDAERGEVRFANGSVLR